MPKQRVGEGESTSSLAKKNGFFWRTIWEHGANAKLKSLRKDPNVLFADDEIFIPEKQFKDLSKPTDQMHKFKRKGEPCKLKVQLMKAGKPRKNEKYVLNLDGKLIDGTTDGDGKFEHFIPCDQATGIQQRLNNLGFDCGSEDGEIGDASKEAIKTFQEAYKLDVTGEADDATKNKLKELCK